MVYSLVHQGARVALFDGDERVTEWFDYDPSVNTGVMVTGGADIRPTHVRVEVGDGEGAFWWPIRSTVAPGDTVAPPHPSEWFESMPSRYLA